MANTWQKGHAAWLPLDFKATFIEGPNPALFTTVRRLADQFSYSTQLPGLSVVNLPVEAMVGGKRHGVGFLTRVSELNGAPLARPVLVQARAAWSVREGKLVLAPGCPETKPRNYQTAFGLSLSPEYERRCLECHGQPNTLGAGAAGGVQCETCHGPGSVHLQALGKGDTRTGILNPKRLTADESIAVCAQCHVGLTKFSDPEPEDLLVANQVVALKTSECFIQSRKALTCSTCHNPHEDAPAAEATSVKACLSCHAAEATPHATICPINVKTDCLGCHMPGIDVGPFHLVDHQIRVHPEQQVRVPKGGVRLASQFEPVSAFLELIEIDGAGHRTKESYLGRKDRIDLQPALARAAANLAYGQTGPPVPVGDQLIEVRRMPRDFKWMAARVEDSAEVRLQRGDLTGSLAQSQQALLLYPQSLRALVNTGRALSEKGDFPGAIAILQRATALYPDDANAAYNLGRSFGKQGRSGEAMDSYRRAIADDPDLVSAYVNLGKALMFSGDWKSALATFRQGLRIDPLSAALYRDLSVGLAREGDNPGSQRALRTAVQIEAGTSPVP